MYKDKALALHVGSIARRNLGEGLLHPIEREHLAAFADTLQQRLQSSAGSASEVENLVAGADAREGRERAVKIRVVPFVTIEHLL